jgi:GNAT superfamily N-acetyltransferase
MENAISYRAATIDDIELLARTRVTFLAAVTENMTDDQKAEQYACNKAYFEEAFANDVFAAFLAFDGEKLAGTSGVNFYKVPPNMGNKSGNVAYISNMYTDPEYRNRGIALQLFTMTVEVAKKRGCGKVGLHATHMGRPVYIKYGFTDPENVLEYSFDE